MATRIKPLKPEESQDEQVNELLKAAQDGWWQDASHHPKSGKGMC